MPRVPTARQGVPATVKGRRLEFSYWPLYKGTRRYGLQSSLFATNPWALIRASVEERCPAAARPEALASLAQGEQLFESAEQSRTLAGKPLLLYYSLLNLAKTYILTVGVRSNLDRAGHGLSEQLKPPNRELLDAYLTARKSPASGTALVFDEFLKSVRGVGLSKKIDLDIPSLLPQIVAGHRLWRDASGKRERFIPLEKIEVVVDPKVQELWLRIFLYADDLSRYSISRRCLLDESSLKGTWREVKTPPEERGERRKLCIEQKTSVAYTSRPSDVIMEPVETLRQQLWTIVASVPPYRKYYLYLAPSSEKDAVLPQLLAVYTLVYYLSSITRYRPQHFDQVMNGKYGNLVLEILTNQPNQFLYLLASEFARREVTRPAVV